MTTTTPKLRAVDRREASLLREGDALYFGTEPAFFVRAIDSDMYEVRHEGGQPLTATLYGLRVVEGAGPRDRMGPSALTQLVTALVQNRTPDEAVRLALIAALTEPNYIRALLADPAVPERDIDSLGAFLVKALAEKWRQTGDLDAAF